MSVDTLDADVRADAPVGVGLHDLPEGRYHADPCPEPSLRASSIDTLLTQTPADYAQETPRLCPPEPVDEDEVERKETKGQRLGVLVHRLLLGKGHEIHVCDFRSFQSSAAKKERADATVRGEIAALAKEVRQAQRIADAALPKLERLFGMWPLGESEMTVIWKRETAHGPIYGRALLDHLSDDRTMIVDLKTTGLSMEDASLAKKVADYGGAYQAAWHTEGVEALHPQLRGRVRFRQALIGVTAPYHVRRIAIPEPWLHMARRRIDRAADTFAECLRANAWPGYPETETVLAMPTWTEKQWLADELEGEDA